MRSKLNNLFTDVCKDHPKKKEIVIDAGGSSD